MIEKHLQVVAHVAGRCGNAAGRFRHFQPWRLADRKGELFVGGDAPLAPVEPHVFRPADDPSDSDRVVFDTMVDGHAMRMNFSGIEFFRMFTP